MSAPPETNAKPAETEDQGPGPNRERPSLRPTFRFAYTGIRVREVAESLRFYTELLGMEIVDPLQSTPQTRGQVVILRSPGSSQLLELNWYEPGSRFGPKYSNGEELDHLCFECDDVEATVAALQHEGVTVIIRSKEIEGWDEAFVKDPNGIWIELLPREPKWPA
jgi:catechol 2,3-dioxygenase-like lactoylglutathione lyase family enzyme